MVISNTHLTINVSDLDKSIQFYESIGFRLQQRWDNHYAQLTGPNLVIGLHPTSEANLKGSSGNLSIGLTSDDFIKVKSQLEQLSIIVEERSEEGGQFLHFNDPDGTSLYFIQPKW